MPKRSPEPALIGVDVGASEVKAHQVVVLERGPRPLMTLGAASAGCLYDHVAGFEPVPIDQQLAERARGAIRAAGIEDEAAAMWIDAAARAIQSVAEQAGVARAAVGMCAPGLKTADGRGLEVVKNGPRCRDFLERVQAALERRGVLLSRPIPSLSSDADACGLGEELAVSGSFRDVSNALYVGGGTGLAEAAKLAGRVVSFDALGDVLTKGWKLVSETGATFEERLSLRSINARFARRAGLDLPLAEGEFPEQRAARGDAQALEALSDVADALAELAASRILALRSRGAIERVVVGQRLGALCADPSLGLIERAEVALARRLAGVDDALRRAALEGDGRLRAGFLVASTLREAPAIGAASLAIHDAARVKGASR